MAQLPSSSSRFPYGASYYPFIYPEAVWETDLRRMAETGFTLLRTNDVHGAWDRLEPQKNNIRFDVLARFYRLAGRYDMQILLSTGAAAPPLWLAREYPDVRLVSSRGEPYPLGGTYHWHCIHHPAYRAESERFIKELAAWAIAQPEHFGWQISNEAGFPFLPTREPGRMELFCYCPTCQNRFRDWLKNRYGSTEALTEAWTWSATTHYYNDWADVTPPEMRPTAWSSVTRWLDWRLFWQDSFAEFARWQHELIRTCDSHHPTVFNTFAFHGIDRFGALMGLDQWKIAQHVDHIGYDIYPGLRKGVADWREFCSIFLDHGKSVSRSVQRDFWMPEVESGPIGGWALGPLHNTSSDDILRYVFECLGHDAKLILYMPWKEWDYQPIRWGALVDLDGEPTPRTQAAARLGRYLRSNAELLRHAHPPQAEIALVDSKPNAIILNGFEQEDTLFAAQRGAYTSCWELGYSIDFVTPELIAAGGAREYRAIILPLIVSLNAMTAQALLRFAEEGGVVVGLARCGMLTERGWYQHRLPMPGLHGLFGVRVVSEERADKISIHYDGRDYLGYLHIETLELDTGTEIVARLSDGRPAVTLHRIGKGYGLYLATQADSGYIVRGSHLLQDVLRSVLQRLRVQPQVQFECVEHLPRAVDAHLLVGEKRMSVLLTKNADAAINGELIVQTRHRITAVECGWETQRPLAYVQEGETVRVAVSLGRDQVVQAVNYYWDEKN